MEWHHFLFLFLVAFVAGAINSVAGGGTLLTFPALLWVARGANMLDFTKLANATSTVALWPGALGSFWGYRGRLPSDRRETLGLALPSFVGGVIGAWLLTRTPDVLFARFVPWLILLATILFVAQGPLARLRQRWTERNRALRKQADSHPTGGEESAVPPTEMTSADHAAAGSRWMVVIACQFLLSVYGGYFGAGIGILMLAAFSWLGFTNIHHMNALKNLLGLVINGIAAAIFVLQGLVHWPIAVVMGAGATLGGFAGAGLAQKIGQTWVRRAVILVGFSMSAWTLYQQWNAPPPPRDSPVSSPVLGN